MTVTDTTLLPVDCGHVPQPEGCGTGYAILPDKRRVCYSCADEMQVADLLTEQRYSGYISSDDKSVTTWTGGHLGRILSCHRNGRQTFIRVVDVHNQHWAGIGPAENGTYTNLRRVKG